MPLKIQRIVLKGIEADGGLYIAAKSLASWEPLIESLFHIQAKSGKSTILAAWSIGAPDYGESATINETTLLGRPEGITAHRAIAIDHSAGSCAAILSALGYADSRSPYSMILIEPPMMTKEVFVQAFQEPSQLKALMDLVKNKKHVWASRADACAWFRKRLPRKRWDDRVLDLFTVFLNLGPPRLPDGRGALTVTLASTREQETAGYVYVQDGFDSLARLTELCAAIPVYCIFGREIDLMQVHHSPETHAGVIDASQGRKMTPVVALEGHAIWGVLVQERPNEVAKEIWRAIDYGHSAKL
ncbi:alpha/beta-hydrolase [Mycena latifolia]|nr:alpha/beta-hydrolase [Mycena latifolia]